MFCTNCGERLEDGMLFCPNCGTKIIWEEPKAEEPKAEEPKAEEPKAEEPKVEEEPKAEAPAYEAPRAAASESGLSWGEEMPAEENQYNYNGTYEQYFTEIFNTEFSDCEVTKEYVRDGRGICYTFTKDGRKALIVELMSRKSNAQKLRNTARREGVPYLRYYIDYDGWWNTRSYVVGRTRAALG